MLEKNDRQDDLDFGKKNLQIGTFEATIKLLLQDGTLSGNEDSFVIEINRFQSLIEKLQKLQEDKDVVIEKPKEFNQQIKAETEVVQ